MTIKIYRKNVDNPIQMVSLSQNCTVKTYSVAPLRYQTKEKQPLYTQRPRPSDQTTAQNFVFLN